MKEEMNNGLENPLDEYYTGKYPKQEQPAPGLQMDMKPVPDSGEESYKGCGHLKGRKALITGGDSGIGRAVAIAYAREGADIAVNYMPSEQKDADSLKELLGKEGVKVVLLPGDLSNEATAVQVVKDAEQALGGIDALVMVAGTQTAVADIMDLTTEQLRHTFETNIFAMFWMVKAALPKMPKGACIITTSSIEAYDPSPMLLDYAATKGAIANFTHSLAKQIAKKGIRVNSVAPGPIWTPLQIAGGQLQENIPDFGKSTPMGRAGQPAELAGVYVFLASEHASYITGEVYGVTGGKHLP